MSRIHRFASSLVVACAATGCGAPTDLDDTASSLARAVVDGSLATAAGATVALMDEGSPGSFCTGTLVAPRVVVTAGHCLEGGDASYLQIAINTLDSFNVPSNRLVNASSFEVHPQYGGLAGDSDDPDGLGEEHDIAVIVLATAVNGVTPVPVLGTDDFDAHVASGTPVTIAGYGQQDENSDEGYGVLRNAQTPYVRRVPSEFFAGGPGEADTCYGDSGGPAYVDVGEARMLLGATSRGPSEDAPCGTGGVYTLVGAFDAWLEEETSGLYVPTPLADDDAPPPDDESDNDDDGIGDDDVGDVGPDEPPPGDDDVGDDDAVPPPTDTGPGAGDDDGIGGEDHGAGPVPGVDSRTGADDPVVVPGGCSGAGTPAPAAALVLALGAARRRRPAMTRR